MEEESKNKLNNPLAIPFAIIIAGLIIAASIIYAFSGASINNQGELNPSPSQTQAFQPDPSKADPISEKDHILGNPSASIKIIEYSDTECPYCKVFHQTMRQLVSLYPDKIAWVFRHFPLTNIHPKAFKEAIATECVTRQGGNDAFWKYLDKIFEITPSNNKLDPSQLTIIAKNIGMDEAKFKECLSSSRYDDLINSQSQNAQEAGAQGTPYSVFISPKGVIQVIDGAYPLSELKQFVEGALNEK